MKKIFYGLLVVLLTLPGCSFWTKKQPIAEVTAPTAPLAELVANMTMPTEFTYHEIGYYENSSEQDLADGWVKGDMRRKDMIFNNRDYSLIGNPQGLLYHYEPDKNMAMAMDLAGEEQLNQYHPFFDHVARVATYAQFVEIQEVAGQKVWLYEYSITNEEQDIESLVQMWLKPDNLFPLKIEMFPDGQNKYILEYQNYQFEAVDEAVFTIPDGTQLYDLNSLREALLADPSIGDSLNLDEFKVE